MAQTRGFTVLETLIASLISAVVAGGTMMAFVAAARMARVRNNARVDEAVGYAQQTEERFRNRVACDDPGFNNTLAFCDPAAFDGAWTAWTNDPLPAPGAEAGGTESILNMKDDNGVWVAATRCYRMREQNCDGNVATPGDCFEVQTHVCWRDLTGCLCPP